MTDDFLVDHSTSFEYGPDPAPSNTRQDTYISYTPESVLRYRARDIQEIIDDTSKLVSMIRHHLIYQVPRLNVLEQYYLSNNPMILHGQRRKELEKSDHRVRHAFAGIIGDFINSYVLGNPVKVSDIEATEDREPSEFIEIVDNFNKANDINAHNLEIGKDQNNLGRAFELIQRTGEDQDRLYRLEPKEVFMIYDQTVRSRVIGACRYYPVNVYEGQTVKYAVELYTTENVIRYQPEDVLTVERLSLEPHLPTEPNPEPHRFSGVPIIEYRSDRFRMAVFEKQLSQIDIYDSAQSDTANYMTDFNDAILVIEGRIQNADNPALMTAMKDANIMILTPAEDFDGRTGAVKASYLTKSYDVAGVEAYKDRIQSDIFQLSSVPNLADSAFAGTQTGVALEYKMFGLQQKRFDKQLFLAKGFRVRYKLLENLNRAVGKYTGEPVLLDFRFTPNLPKALLEELKNFVDAGGEVSQQTKLKLLSFVDDVKLEQETLELERGVMPYSDLEMKLLNGLDKVAEGE